MTMIPLGWRDNVPLPQRVRLPLALTQALAIGRDLVVDKADQPVQQEIADWMRTHSQWSRHFAEAIPLNPDDALVPPSAPPEDEPSDADADTPSGADDEAEDTVNFVTDEVDGNDEEADIPDELGEVTTVEVPNGMDDTLSTPDDKPKGGRKPSGGRKPASTAKG